eukprot:c29238_g2_i2 orf=207-2666(+)
MPPTVKSPLPKKAGAKKPGTTPPAKKTVKTPVKSVGTDNNAQLEGKPEVAQTVQETKSRTQIKPEDNPKEFTSPPVKTTVSLQQQKGSGSPPAKVTSPPSSKKRKTATQNVVKDGDGDKKAAQQVEKTGSALKQVSAEAKTKSESTEMEVGADQEVKAEEGEDGAEERTDNEDTESEGEEDEEGDDYGEEGDEEAEGEEIDGGEVAEEHPELQESRPVTERQKRKKLEVFVGGLDKDATEDDVKKVFEQVGEVVEVRLMRNTLTGKNKGYAFVRFANAAQATRAATEMKKTQIRGRMCGVVPSEDNDVLFLGNINKSWKREQVEEKLKEYGIRGIEELSLMQDPRNEGKNRGFAFLELATHNDAIRAHQRLQKPDAVFGVERSAKVAWAEPQNDPDEAVMAQVKSVFVDGMPASWSEDKVRQQFGHFGEIERIVLACNMPTARRKDFGFVNFATREAAVACIDFFKDADLNDGEIKVKVNVRLAKPAPKLKPKAVKGIVQGDHLTGYPRPWRNDGHDYMDPRRNGRGFLRGAGRAFGRFNRRPYDNDDDYDRASVQRLLRALKHVAEEDRYLSDKPRGPPSRPSRLPSRGGGGYNRREEAYLPQRSHISRFAGDRSSLRHGDFREDYPHRSPPAKRVNRLPRRPPPRDDAYLGHGDHIREFDESNDRIDDYSQPGPGMKRPFSSMDDNPSYYDSRSHGYPRSRVDYGGVVLPPPPHFDSVRAPLGPSSFERASEPPISGVTVSQPMLGSYDHHQPGGMGTSFGNMSATSALYGAGSRGYGPLSGASDYMSSAGEMRGTSLYGSRSGAYNLSGAASNSYY